MPFDKKLLDDLFNKNKALQDTKHCIYQGDNLRDSEESAFRKKYLSLHEGEELYCHIGMFTKNPLFRFTNLSNFGLAITNFGLHFNCGKDHFLANVLMYPTGGSGFINYDDLDSVEFDEFMVGTYGTAYDGHKFFINKDSMGIIRIGNGMLEDTPVLDFSKELFEIINKK
tara:strand:- start:57 stop:566 length:510 start_codon:yes stop_codon:yes gene_type:complete